MSSGGLFGERAFMGVFVGQAASQVGDYATRVGIAFGALALPGGERTLATALLAQNVALVLSLLAGGVLADRFSARTMMLGVDGVRVLAAGALCISFASGSPPPGVFFALTALLGLCEGLFQPSFSSALPELLAEDQLPTANGLATFARRTASLSGGALGGALAAAGGLPAVFAFDCATFVVSLLGVLLGGAWPVAHRSAEATRPLEELRAGFAYVLARPWLWISLVVFALALLLVLSPVQVLLPARLHRSGGGAAGIYGATLSAQGVGGLFAGLAIARMRPRRRRLGIYASLVLVGLSSLGYALIGAAVPLIAVGVVAGVGISAANTLWVTALQANVPRALLGRVSSIDWLASYALTPVSYALLAVIGGSIAPGTLLLVGGTSFAGIAAVIGRSHRLAPLDGASPADEVIDDERPALSSDALVRADMAGEPERL